MNRFLVSLLFLLVSTTAAYSQNNILKIATEVPTADSSVKKDVIKTTAVDVSNHKPTDIKVSELSYKLNISNGLKYDVIADIKGMYTTNDAPLVDEQAIADFRKANPNGTIVFVADIYVTSDDVSSFHSKDCVGSISNVTNAIKQYVFSIECYNSKVNAVNWDLNISGTLPSSHNPGKVLLQLFNKDSLSTYTGTLTKTKK